MAEDSFDFSSPFVAARLLIDGEEYPLWTRGMNKEAFDIPTLDGNELRALSFLSEISIASNLGYIPVIKAVLTPPYEDAIKLLDSELLTWGPGHRLQVHYGYSTSPTGPIFATAEGMINAKPDFTFGSEISITINAQGCGGNLSAQYRGAEKSWKGTLRKVIEDVCKECHWTAVFDDPNIGADKDGTVKAALDATVDINQAGRSYLLFIQQLLQDINCIFHLSGSNSDGSNASSNADGSARCLIIARSQMLSKQAPDHVLAFYALKGSLGAFEIPMFSASSPAAGLFLPGATPMLMKEVDKDSRKVRKKTLGLKENNPSATGTQAVDIKKSPETVAGGDDNQQSNYEKAPGDPAEIRFVDAAKAAWTQFQSDGMGTVIDAECLGAPTLQPGLLVSVRGLGRRFSGPNPTTSDMMRYVIHAAEHVINGSGYTTKVHLIANTDPMVAAAIAASSPGDVNKETTPLDGTGSPFGDKTVTTTGEEPTKVRGPGLF